MTVFEPSRDESVPDEVRWPCRKSKRCPLALAQVHLGIATTRKVVSGKPRPAAAVLNLKVVIDFDFDLTSFLSYTQWTGT